MMPKHVFLLCKLLPKDIDARYHLARTIRKVYPMHELCIPDWIPLS